MLIYRCVWIRFERNSALNLYFYILLLVMEKQFHGLIDLLNETIIPVNTSSPSSSELLVRERLKLIEKLADIDDQIAELLLNDKPMTNLQLTQAICRLMVNDQSFVPVLVGSSLKNLGVPTLLDAIVHFLPSARVIPTSSASNIGTLMYIFKTIHDRQKQPLSFARVYAGSVKKRMSLTNARTNEKEQITKVFLPFADNMDDVDEIRAGSIAVLSGLKDVSRNLKDFDIERMFGRHQVETF